VVLPAVVPSLMPPLPPHAVIESVAATNIAAIETRRCAGERNV
jgi:hypothetical protein